MANLNVAVHSDVSTYTNGSQSLEPFIRVFDVAGSLRPASAIELENGIVIKRVQPYAHASVLSLQNNQRVTMVAANAISIGADVYAASNGRVASTGTRAIGKAMTTSSNAGDHIEVMIQIAIAAGGEGSGDNEVLLSAVPLSGTAPAGYKLGFDYAGKRLYFVNGSGEWEADVEDYDWTQLTPSSTWTIPHNKGKYPDDVTIFNTAGAEVFASIANPTTSTTVITFALPTAGRANLEFQ